MKMTQGSRETHLTRTCSVRLGDGARYTVRSLLAEPGTCLPKGTPVLELSVTRSRRQGDETIDETVFETRRFEVDRYASPRLAHFLVVPGQELAPGEVPILEYVVEDTFANVVETAVRGMAASPSDLHAAPAIPEKKLRNATQHYAKGVDSSRVLFLYDDTVFGSAKDGYLVTDSAFYYSSTGRAATIRFNDLKGLRLAMRTVQEGGKPVSRQCLYVRAGDGEVEIDGRWTGLSLDGLESFLALVARLREAGQTKDVDGYVVVEHMPDAVKSAYLGLLVWLTYQDDGTIDERELSELQVLMTQLDFHAELRHAVRAMVGDPALLDAEEMVRQMLAATPSGSELALSGSLVKDAIRVRRATGQGPAAGQPGVRRLAGMLGIGDDQAAFIEEAAVQDERILAGELSDDQVTVIAKEMAAKASAVGVPIAAVYLSGSVTGLSAAGITSGLSALGLGGVLGLSSMVTGIGVAIVLGVGIYKGMQWLMGGTARDKASRRELMLQEVLRIHQKAIANLAEDVAFFAQKLVTLTVDVERNKATIDKLSRELTMFATAIARLRAKESSLEGSLEAETNKRAA